jgi:hypothetical protein
MKLNPPFSQPLRPELEEGGLHDLASLGMYSAAVLVRLLVRTRFM